MKYYPLEVIDKMNALESSTSVLDMIKEHDLCDKDATLEDLYEYAYSVYFFMPEYEGKFKKWNDAIMYNKKVNKIFFPMYAMDDFDRRQTEWKDIVSTSLVVDKWKKSKMVYRIDNDFFHEIKNTENIITSKEIFDRLPFDCFFIDLTQVENISRFKGAWVNIVKTSEEFYGVNIYMIQDVDYTFFTYYSWYKFNDDNEIEWKPDDLPKSDFIARSFVDASKINLNKTQREIEQEEQEAIMKLFRETITNPIEPENLVDVTLDMSDEYDPRQDIVIAIFQIMTFISVDASDISENPNTKQTYRPSTTVKNKFSEVRMWDVGVRYGQAIHVAKQEYKKYVKKYNGRGEGIKERKPVRPHMRRAHWHRYHIGKGRQETKLIWLAPTYVCGNHEIPVTIREIKK